MAAAMVPAVLALAACGSSSKKSGSASSGAAGTPSTLALSVSEAGKAASFKAPTSTKGGLVRVSLTNNGKMPHAAQFVLVEGGHQTAEALKVLASNSNTTPAWMRAEGGVSTTAPGQTGSATVILPAGKYLVADLGGPGSSGPPAHSDLSVSNGSAGSLPSAPASVTAAAPAKDKYSWQISGLHAGHNQFTFKSEGPSALHLVAAVRIKPGQNPSLNQIQQSFQSNGPPKFADLSSYASTAVLDGGKSQVASLDLKPGTYVFFCPLTDRDGGKPHTAEGLLTKYTVK